MTNKNSYTPIYIIIAVIVIFSLSLLAFSFLKNGSLPGLTNQSNKQFPLDMDVLSNLKLSYSDSWSITNNGPNGIDLSNGDVSILLTTAKVEGKTLDEIIDSRNEVLKASKKILSDTKSTINSIVFRRLEFGSLDETTFPSDGLLSYSALVNNDIYLVFIINFPAGQNPTEAENLVNTIRYN